MSPPAESSEAGEKTDEELAGGKEALADAEGRLIMDVLREGRRGGGGVSAIIAGGRAGGERWEGRGGGAWSGARGPVPGVPGGGY